MTNTDVGANLELVDYIDGQLERAIGAYQEDIDLLEEHANLENSLMTSGYASRQVLELIQNAADALLRSGTTGRVTALLTPDALYVANEGAPIDQNGARALTHAYLSKKSGDEIGRFGQGFKSVLAITSNPQIFSDTVSFEFNAERTRSFLQKRLPDGFALPILRLPWLVDREMATGSDPNLKNLLEWASTVVKLPLRQGYEHVKAQLQDFPTRFLLFAKHVQLLDIEIQEKDGSSRYFSHTCEKDPTRENIYAVSRPDSTTEKWLLNEAIHRPSEKAKQQIGLATVRDEIKIAYAAPLNISAHNRIGSFWAYYPLNEETTATGIFNAPWALNEDRTTMLRTAYNDEILEQMSKMFVDTIKAFSTVENPAQHFYYLPSREQENKGYSDRVLTQQIPRRAAVVGIIPDQNSVLRHASELSALSFSREFSNWQSTKSAVSWHQLWQKHLNQDVLVPHFSVYGDLHRFTRLRQLFAEHYATVVPEPEVTITKRRAATDVFVPSVPLNEWLEMLLTNELDFKGMAVALRLLANIPDEMAQKSGLTAKIIPTNLGVASPSQNSSVFLPLPDEEETNLPGVRLVVPEFLQEGQVEASLRSFKFCTVDPGEVTKFLFTTLGLTSSDEDWLRAWDSLLDVAAINWGPLLRKVFEEREIKVLTKSGEWRTASKCFVAAKPSSRIRFEDPSMEVDTQTCPVELAKLAGAISGPVAHFDIRAEKDFDSYLQWARLELRRAHPDISVAQVFESDFVESQGFGPVSIFRSFSKDGYEFSAREWSAALLQTNQPVATTWEIRSKDSHSVKVPAPHLWAIMQHGYLETSLGMVKTTHTLGPRAITLIPYFPVALDPATRVLNLPDTQADIPLSHWNIFFDTEHKAILRDTKSQQDYSRLALFGIQLLTDESTGPKNVPAIRNGKIELKRTEEVQLVFGDDEMEQILDLGVPYLIADSEELRDLICSRTLFKNASSSISVSIERIPSTIPELASDRFPSLTKYLDDVQQQTSLQFCSVLSKRVNSFGGLKEEQLDSDYFGGTVFIIDGATEEQILDHVCGHLDLGLTSIEQSNVLQEVEDQRVAILRESCRAAKDDTARLSLLADARTLESHLPQGLKPSLRAFGVTIDDTNVAQVFLDTHGFNALNTLRNELDQKGLNPPKNWAGSSTTVRFVQSLGFDRAYAGETSTTAPATEAVLGRPGLHPLHDYQEDAFLEIRKVLTSSSGDALKGMVELPTGAGKTRVAVESIIRLFLSGELRGPILWIAESDELCSQATETWSEVWREFADNRTLTISRFWGSRTIERPTTELSVVVATDAKLRENLPLDEKGSQESHEYDWLRETTALIVDEGHRATSHTYTQIFQYFGIKTRGSSMRPLLGLSATPFKGRSDELTSRLASRFGKNLITTLGPDPIKELQKRGVLSLVEHEFLEGTTIDLSGIDMYRTDSNLLNNKALELVREKVGSDGERTKRLVNHILSRPQDESILVFTSSVLNAQVLAALLINRGLKAAAISGATKPNLRRSIINQFKSGSIQVLVNCDVLLQGFDAPKVRTLYVARPTFNPNRYIQMVGRGLRGPRNGGTERCLIVDLQDELVGSSHELAYREFTSHWKGE